MDILFCAVVLPKYLLYIHDMYVSDVSAENIHAVYPLPVCAKGESVRTLYNEPRLISPSLSLPALIGLRPGKLPIHTSPA